MKQVKSKTILNIESCVKCPFRSKADMMVSFCNIGDWYIYGMNYIKAHNVRPAECSLVMNDYLIKGK
jgi:hypothetical protein